jgi:NAD(P)-dependent dehydrogenase (short-subunit alcohol dehydrogenase family)
MTSSRFSDRVVLVTGAANGIGSEICSRFAQEGARVFGADVSWDSPPDESREAASSEIRQLRMDVTEHQEIQATVDEIVSSERKIDVLVNNAGLIIPRPLAEVSREDWNRTFEVNSSGLFFCLQAVAKTMVAAVANGALTSGSIVNIASVAGLDGRTTSTPYGASKASVINITRSTARELAKHGIRVNAVCPGIIDTAFNARLGDVFGPQGGITSREWVEARADGVPVGRLGTARDVANAVAFLASDDASYITAQTLNVDGGFVPN